MSYRSYSNNWNNNKYKHSITGIFGNCNYHFNTILGLPFEWDVYAGGSLGFFMWNTDDKDYNGSGSSGLGLYIQIGGRYYFKDNLAVNLEFGSGNVANGGKFGITYIF